MSMSLDPKIVDECWVKLEAEDHDDSGNDCWFIDFKNGWGLKCYPVAEDCEISYTVQKYCAERDWGPQVGDKVTVGNWYCHVTEVVEPLERAGHDNSFPDVDEWCDSWEFGHGEEIDECCVDFRNEIGYGCTDQHAGNFGYDNNTGKVIPIDFSGYHKLYGAIKDGTM